MSSIVPEGWEAKELGDIATFSGGSAFKEMYQGENSGKHPFIKVSDMNLPENNRYIAQANNWVSEEIRQQAKIKLFPSDSVVFAKVGAALLLNRRRQLIRETAIDNNMMAAIPNTCDHNFLYYSMQSIDLANIVQSGAVPSVNQSQMESIPIVTPPLPEQKKIASILTSVDEVIENTQEQIDKLQDLKKATMNELLTKGIGHTEFKDSELGRIPKSWDVKAISQIVKIPNGQVDPKEEPYASMRHIGSGNIEGWTGVIHSVVSAKDAGQISGKYLFNEGHILYSKVRPNLAKTCYPRYEGVCSADIYPLMPIGNVDKMYLLEYLLTEKFVLAATEVSERTGMPKINRQDLSTLKIKIPPINEQKKMGKIIEAISLRIGEMTRKYHQTQSLKKSLMQDLLTGKVRVTVN